MAPLSTQTPAMAARNAFTGFYLSGILMAFLGAMLPAWGYHLHSDYSRVGYFFLSLNGGMLLSVPLSQWLLSRRSLRFVMALAPAVAAAAFFFLAAVGPPRGEAWRLAGVFCSGTAAGVLNAAVFTLVSPVYQQDRAATLNLSGLFFGLGSLTSAVLVAGTYYIYTTGAILIFLGIIPGFLAGHYARTRIAADRRPAAIPVRQAYSDFKSPAAILFALLLFFQFGNEWAIAGWGPLFLAQRLGIGPDTALWLVTIYWLALILGRALMQAVLPVVRHGRLLLGSVVSAMLGCLILSLTNNKSGAGVALLMIGGGFAAIYPLVVEKIGDRFPYYHPGLFNGLFSFAVTGGLLSAASLGFWAEWLGIGVIMALPLVGSIMVFFLLVAIWVEAKWLSR
ncbi:MAG: MFS transporter [Acidobacteria bacterium]|nr:MFS transporter [Acidobacteriota bacterium]